VQFHTCYRNDAGRDALPPVFEPDGVAVVAPHNDGLRARPDNVHAVHHLVVFDERSAVLGLQVWCKQGQKDEEE